MAVLKAQYRVTIYAADDTTPLTPRVGSPHSDNFQVITKAGVGGWKPYLRVNQLGAPDEPRIGLNRLTGLTEIGQITVQVGDVKLTNNVTRWVTAFYGDPKGRNQFEGYRLRREISLDDGANWADDYVGRIVKFTAPDPDGELGPHFEFIVRDERIQETRDLFVGVPHHSITYARPATLLPNTIPNARPDATSFAWNGWPGIHSILLRGKIATDGDGRYIILTTQGGDPIRNPYARLTRALAVVADYTAKSAASGRFCPFGRVWLRNIGAGTNGHFWLAPVTCRMKGVLAYDGNTAGNRSALFIDDGQGADEKGVVRAVGITPLPSTHPSFMALPADGTLVDFEVYNAGPPSADAPLLIKPTDAATLLEDICAGKFSLLNDTGFDDSANDGSIAVQPMLTDASSFTTLKADATVRSLVFAIDRVFPAGQFIAEQIVRIAHIYGQQRADGKLYATDLRLASTTGAGLNTLDNTDCDAADWEQGEEGVNVILVTSYQDTPIDTVPADHILNLPSNFLRSTPVTNTFLLDRLKRLPIRPLRLDALGARAVVWDTEPNWAGKLDSVTEPYRQLYGDGAAVLSVTARRSSKTNDLFPGHWIKVNLDKVPNASTNTRGGTRLFQCLERVHSGAGYRFRLIDAGPDSVAVVPTVASPAYVTHHGLSCAITLNANAEPVTFQIAVVATGAGRPADSSALWKTRATVTSSSTVQIGEIPRGKRIYVRGISTPVAKLPSGPAYPAGTDFIDSTAITAPSALATSVNGRSVVLTWTVGDQDYGVMPTLNGAAHRQEPLPPASARYAFDELDASTLFTFGVKHVDAFGGESALTTTTATTGTADTLSAPRALQILQGRATGTTSSLAPEANQIGFGFELSLRPQTKHAHIRLQVGLDVGFSSIEQDITLQPGTTVFRVRTPIDGAERFFRARHERTGWAPSDWSEIVSAFPTALVDSTDLGGDQFAGGWAYLSLDSDGTVRLHIGTDDGDTEEAYYEISVASGFAAGTYPTVDTSDTQVLEGSMPFHSIVTVSGLPLVLRLDQKVLVTVRFRGAGIWGQTVYDDEVRMGTPAIVAISSAPGVPLADVRLGGFQNGDTELVVTRRIDTCMGFRYTFSKNVPLPDPQPADGTEYVFLSSEGSKAIPFDGVKQLAAGETAYVYVWPIGFPVSGGTTGSFGFRILAKWTKPGGGVDTPHLQIGYDRAALDIIGMVAIKVDISDPQNRGGTFECWTSPLSGTGVPNSGGAADATVAVSSTPAQMRGPSRFVPAGSYVVDALVFPIADGVDKTIFVEYAPTGGTTSGPIAFTVPKPVMSAGLPGTELDGRIRIGLPNIIPGTSSIGISSGNPNAATPGPTLNGVYTTAVSPNGNIFMRGKENAGWWGLPVTDAAAEIFSYANGVYQTGIRGLPLSFSAIVKPRDENSTFGLRVEFRAIGGTVLATHDSVGTFTTPDTPVSGYPPDQIPMLEGPVSMGPFTPPEDAVSVWMFPRYVSNGAGGSNVGYMKFPSCVAAGLPQTPNPAPTPTMTAVVQAAEQVSAQNQTLFAQFGAQSGAMIGPPAQAVTTQPVYDDSAIFALIDTLQRRLDNLTQIQGEGTLSIGPATISDGLNQRAVAKAHGQGTCQGGSVSGSAWANGSAVTFAETLQDVPFIELLGGAEHEPRYSKWTAGFDPCKPVRRERVAINPSATGFTPQARFAQDTGTVTTIDDNFAGTLLDFITEADTVTLSSAPASNNIYTFRVSITTNPGGFPADIPNGVVGYNGYVEILLAFEFNDGGGWVERGSLFISDSGFNSDNHTVNHSIPIAVAGMGASDQVRVVVKNIYLQNGLGSANAQATDVQYPNSTGVATYASMTPDQSSNANDRVLYRLLATT